MKKIKKITIDDVLQQKKVIKAHEMYYDSIALDGRVDFEKINPSKVMEIMQEIADDTMSVYNASMYLIYLSVPMFRNKKIQEKYEIKGNPYEVIEHIFNEDVTDIVNFGAKILKIYGFSQENLQAVKK